MEAVRAKHKKKLKRKQILTLAIMLCVMFLMLISFAWFYFKADKEVDSELADVMAPYYLYLLDEDGDSLSLSIGSLHPGETKQVIIGVSNKPAGGESLGDFLTGKDSKFEYQMALAYTMNLPIEYQVYQLNVTSEEDSEFKVQDPDSDETIYLEKSLIEKEEEISKKLTEQNNEEMYGEDAQDIVNYVQYDLYPYDAEGNTLQLETKVSGTSTTYGLDYYLIEMEWKEGIEFQNFIKETDLIYVIVDAVQPKPEAREETGNAE